MLSGWITTTNVRVQDLDRSPSWDKAYWRKQKSGNTTVSNGTRIFMLRVAPWHPVEDLRGKFVIHGYHEGFNCNNTLPGTTVPYVFDNLEEAQAVYDLIADKE